MLLGFLFCKEALARLDDYLDRELSPREMKQVATHLKVCAHCAQLYRFERAFIEDLCAKIDHIEAPPELMSDIHRALDEASAPNS